MSNEAQRDDGGAGIRQSFGADIRTPAPAAAPMFGARPPGLLVRLAKLVAGKARAKVKAAAAAPSGAPDPSKIFPTPRFSADGSQLSAGQSDFYDHVGEELRQEAGELDIAAAEKATEIGGRIAASLLDQMEASAVHGLSASLRALMALGLVLFLAAFSWRVASQLVPAPFSYAALYAFFGLLGAVAAGLAADAAASEAKKRFGRASDDLESLVARASGRFSDRLKDLRAAMVATGAADLPGAIAAASRARMTTVAGLRFYERSPVIGAAADGYRCPVLAGAIAAEATRRLSAGTRIIGRLSTLIFGIAVGVAVLFLSLAQPPSFAAPPDIIGALIIAEKTRPGIVVFALAIGLAIFAPHLLGPMAARLIAADDPAGALRRYGLDAAANGLKDRALAAAAERPGEMVERFADALRALEAQAEASSRTGTRFGAAADADELPWRKAPEGPQFVAQNFQSAPPRFLADAPVPSRRGFFSRPARPDAPPKQGFAGVETPPWLKN